MKLIWATRGRTWGFRFLRGAALPDPLIAYEEAFSGIEDEMELCRRVGETLALRFPDPEGREDRSGRTIPHDFVVFEPLAGEIRSVEDGLRLLWPLIADDFARVWLLAEPPPPID
ncbi:hypothetical protein [Agromyces sp. NPDC055661]